MTWKVDLSLEPNHTWSSIQLSVPFKYRYRKKLFLSQRTSPKRTDCLPMGMVNNHNNSQFPQ